MTGLKLTSFVFCIFLCCLCILCWDPNRCCVAMVLSTRETRLVFSTQRSACAVIVDEHTHTTTVWAHGLVPGHSDSSAGGAPAVEDYDYEGSYDYDGNPKTSASANSTRYALSFNTKVFLFLSFFMPFVLSLFSTRFMDIITMPINSKYLPLTITT